jgi:hypothetical protein
VARGIAGGRLPLAVARAFEERRRRLTRAARFVVEQIGGRPAAELIVELGLRLGEEGVELVERWADDLPADRVVIAVFGGDRWPLVLHAVHDLPPTTPVVAVLARV